MPSRLDRIDLYVVWIALVALGAAGAVAWSWSEYAATTRLRRDAIPQIKKDIEDMLKVQEDIRKLRLREGAPVRPEDRPTDALMSYLQTELVSAGISESDVKNIAKVPEVRRSQFIEKALKVDVSATDCKTLAKVLYKIEHDRPFVKTKDLIIRRLGEEGECESVSITFAWYDTAPAEK
ncbi:MAG: hypothetical protein HYY93_02155 [Planctomycetes bacterium]|nr:hypothetical protein [Planctomycetota bacterium]